MDLDVFEAIADMPVFDVNEDTGAEMEIDVFVDLSVAITTALEVAQETYHCLVIVLIAVLAFTHKFC